MPVIKEATVYDIDVNALVKRGVTLFLFDADDTIAGYSAQKLPQQTTELFKQIQLLPGVQIVVATNASRKRKTLIANVLAHIGIPVAGSGKKPDPVVFADILKSFNRRPDQSVMVGDRLGTDLWGAYLSEIPNLILVEPYSSRFQGNAAPAIIRVMRWLEFMASRTLLQHAARRGL